MVISELMFLLLEIEDKWSNKCTLVQYATLHALNKIERDLDTPNKITFYWNIPSNNNYNQELYVEKANYCISHLLARVRKLGIETERKVENKHKLSKTEVTDESLKTFNIEQTLAEIEELEKKQAVNYSLENLQLALAKYQEVYLFMI